MPVSVTKTDPPTAISDKSGIPVGTIIGVAGGLLLAALLMIIFVLRRRRSAVNNG